MIKLVKTILLKLLYVIGFLFVNKTEQASVVFLRLDAIGDFVLWISMAQEFKKLNPDSRIVLICTKSTVDIAKLSGAYDEVLVCDKKKIHVFFSKPVEFFVELMKWSVFKCKQLIVPVYSRTTDDEIISYLIKAEKKIAIDGDTTGIELKDKVVCDKIYDQSIKTFDGVIHELERNAEFISGLCGVKISSKASHINININRTCDENYFVIMPGASISWKCWDINNFVNLAKQIQKETGYTCVLCGDKKDEKIVSVFGKERGLRLIDKVGQTTVIELISCIQGAKLFVGNDSAGIHIANAVGTKSLAVFHGAHFGRFLPYPTTVVNNIVTVYEKKECFGCAHGESSMNCYIEECIDNIYSKNRFLCVDQVKVEKVFTALKENGYI